MEESKRKLGRPAKTLTEIDKAKLPLLALIKTQEQIADYFGMSRRAFVNLLNRDPEVYDLYKNGVNELEILATSKLLELVRRGDKSAIFFLLKTRFNWRETNHLDVTTKISDLENIKAIELIAVDSVEKDGEGEK